MFILANEDLYKSEDNGLSWQKTGTISLTDRHLNTLYVDLPLRVAAQCPYLGVYLTAPLLRRCFDAQEQGGDLAPGQSGQIDLTVKISYRPSLPPTATSLLHLPAKNALIVWIGTTR